MAGPMTAPTMPVPTWEMAVNVKLGATSSSKEPATTSTDPSPTTRRLARTASVRAPAGVVASMPAMPPSVIT